jgi:hypothetical protein
VYSIKPGRSFERIPASALPASGSKGIISARNIQAPLPVLIYYKNRKVFIIKKLPMQPILCSFLNICNFA